MTYQFIDEHREEYSVKRPCSVLEVTASGYYTWQKRQLCKLHVANQRLVQHIQQVCRSSRGSYGSPRIHAALQRQGIACNHKHIERLMRVHGIASLSRRRRPTTTHVQPDAPVASTVLQRDFTATPTKAIST